MDTLSNLKAFIAVADAGSFSAAGRQLSLVPSVVAKRIDQLEWLVRSPLFTRSTRKLTLTDVGERYLQTVRGVVRQVDEALTGMARSQGEIEGHIRIKLPTTLGVLYLSDILNAFLISQPKVSMDVVMADRSVNPIEEGFDMALGALPELYGRVQDHPLCLIRRRLCAAPSYLARRAAPEHPAELVDHDCLVFTTSGSRWEFESPQGLIGIDVRPRLRTNDGAAMCQACVSGQGVAVLTDYIAQTALHSGALVEIMQPYTVPSLWLKALVPNSRADVPRVRMLLDWLDLHLKPLAPWEKLWPAQGADNDVAEPAARARALPRKRSRRASATRA